MIKKITLFTMVLLFCFKSAFADPINKKTALLVANKWINKNQQKNAKSAQENVASIKEVYYENSLVYYLINFNSGGFVIVSADDATKPILGYSDKGTFDTSLNTPQMKGLLNAYKSFVYESAKAQKVNRKKVTKSAWNKILNPSKNKSQKRTTTIAPFMDDILYTQSSGFERFCPSDNDGQAIVGCVATAMSQVMRYWEFPSTGRGQTSYNHRKYGNLSVNFEEQTYDWSNMSKTRADNENAKLSYHAGVAVKMNYGTSANGGSGAYTSNALSALKRNFKYNSGASMVYRYRYSDQEWNTLIKEQLNEKRPVLYSGRSKNLQDPNAGGAGHLFALDGYDTTDQGDFFHINWGWAGRSNGYFYLTEMVTHGGKYNWIDNNAVMLNLYPTNLAPVFKSEPITFIDIDKPYQYEITTIDENKKDIIKISLKNAPSWLNLTLKNNVYTLEGTPSNANSGEAKITLEATDGTNTTTQIFTITVGKNKSYCESKGNRIKYEWIDLVSFGDLTNTTGANGGYADFTNQVATITAGSTNDLTISAAFSGSSYKEYFSVWIDYNQNGSFEDNERVVNTSTTNNTNIVTSIKVPGDVKLGSTRMRVSMKYKYTQTPCESFDDGEVEDYTVNIVQTSARKSNKNTASNSVLIDLQLYPNPTSKTLNIRTDKVLKNAHYKIIDANGKTVDENSFSPSINIENLKTGVYFIKMFDKNIKYSKSFIKSRE
ncbi:Por secretion system C-terminal sorting domain-containing protein [Tenacibaculum sp. MAR_2010_89]|uniref:C10 family peptidase n=1 Tax=Tenacibaculum sp. MAR_2010_89 TaxID=1250198 RepID=UPI00089A6B42|nr:C10 family peptidase [Tenacibaculum sp. MAR_2010_89]SED55431.1 Por secretion system C-terminal sorting domain-containing protein [Tenacibaculum sp. MAR_2010_89]